MSTKEQLDQRVALLTGREVHEIAAITSTFLRLVANDLVRGEKVTLLSFGRFKMKTVAGKLRVVFHRSNLFNRLLQQHRGGMTMEKYGVDETKTQTQEQLEKAAAEGCPVCGSKVEREGNLLICPKCGTAPFEK